MTSDDRVTRGLITDVFDVLERHGYRRYDNQHTSRAFGMVFDLAYACEGARDTSYWPYLQPGPSAPPAEPGPSGPDADAATLTDGEVRTVVAALDIAADFKRDRAAACADCADPACLTSQSRLRDARAYAQMAAQMLQTAKAARTAKSGQPTDRLPALPTWLHLPADKEAGQ